MIFDTPGDVIQAVSDRQADMRLLRTRFEADYDLINLVPYEPERKGYNSYTCYYNRCIAKEIRWNVFRCYCFASTKMER